MKLRLYASAGIPEFWIVEAIEECVEVYRTPEVDGYRDLARVGRDGRLSPLSFPDVTLSVADLFA